MTKALNEYMLAFPSNGREMTSLMGKITSVVLAEMQHTTDAVTAGKRVVAGTPESDDLDRIKSYATDVMGNAYLATVAMMPGGWFTLPAVTPVADKLGLVSKSVKTAFAL